MSEQVAIGEGLWLPVLNLKTIIHLKEELGGEKDRAMLPILRKTLEETERSRDN